MRVTNSMIAGRVVFNAQNSLSRFLSLQTQMSTGKRINKPSDNPLGITRDLDYRNELANNKQHQANILRAKSWSQTNDNIIGNLNELVSDAKGFAISGADEAFDEGRDAFAISLRTSIDKILNLGNSQLEGRYMFSGFMTDSQAMQGHANGMSFRGDTGSIKYQIESNVEVGVNFNGADLFLKNLLTLGEGFDLDVGINGTTQLTTLHNGNGVDQVPGQIQIRDLNLGIDVTVDLNAETTIDEVITQINNDLVLNGITNLTVRIADDNNSLLFDTTKNGLIAGSTPLNNINNGAGVDLTSGLINVSNGVGVDLNIDLSTAVTVNDVISQFNAQLVSGGVLNVSMGINAAGTGFEINDTNGVSLDLRVEDISNNTPLAEQLGIVGLVDPSLVGNDLAPNVHFTIEELGGTTANDLGILSEFNGDFIGGNLDAQLLATSNVSDLKNGLGLTDGEIVMWQGGSMKTIDFDNPSIVTVQDVLNLFNSSGLNITASINDDGRGIQVVNNDPNTSFTIEEVGDGSAAKKLGIFGSPDMAGSFFVLANSMESSRAGAQEEIGSLLDNFDFAMDNVLNIRSANGSKGVRLASTEHRLLSQEFMFTSRLSELEDADLTKLVTDLSIYETNYQAALMASARIIQPTLLSFLR